MDSLSYSGRLVNADGSPVTGPVDLQFKLGYTGTDPIVAICTRQIDDVSLTKGVFHLKLSFDPATHCGGLSITQILAAIPAGETIAIQVIDNSVPATPKPYPYQAIHSIPSSIMSKMAMTLSQMGATDGQFLKWNGSSWVPSSVTGATGGTVTEISTGTGLTGGPISDSGTISIANSGVDTLQLADGAVTDAKIASGITRTKLSNGTANYVLVNNGTGVISETEFISVAQGGTGASTVSGAWTNLGLGTSAGYDYVACNVGEVSKFIIPGGWTCIADSDSLDSTKLPLAGGTMTGAIDMNSLLIINLANPSDPGDAANKAYVDAQITGSSLWSENGSDIYRSSGKVGIGTNTPGSNLEISDVTQASLTLTNTDPAGNPNGHITLKNYRKTWGAGDPKFVSFVARGTPASPSAVASGMTLMSLEGRGYGDSSPTWSNTKSAWISFVATSNWLGGGHAPSDMIFGTSTTERMRLDEIGRLGIATNNPQRTLHVAGSQRIERNGTPHLEIIHTGAAADNQRWRLSANSNGNFFITPYTDADVNIGNGLQIDHAGKVGVGVLSPTANLHLPAGTTTANTAPLKFTAGTNLSTPEPGAIEYDGTNLYFTDSSNIRKTISTTSGGAFSNVSSIAGSGALSIAAGGTDQNLTLSGSGNGVVRSTSPMVINNTASSTSPSTGAMQVYGGMGVQENIFAGGDISAEGVFIAPLGTSLLPSYTFTGDLNTGVYSPGADTWAVSTAGSEKLRIDSAGNVGIGTSSPTYVLDVQKASSGSDTMAQIKNSAVQVAGATATLGLNTGLGTPDVLLKGVATDATAGARKSALAFHTYDQLGSGLAEKMRITSGGNVGIGTSNPASITTPADRRIVEVSGSGANNADSAGAIYLSNNRPTPASGDSVGGLVFISQNNPGPTDGYKIVSVIQSKLEGTGGANGFGSNLTFHTKTDNGGRPERMRIDSKGNLGIGTNTPQFPLHIRSTGAYLALEDSEDANGSIGAVSSYQTGAMYYDANVNNTASSGEHFFRADGGTKNLLVLKNSGNVGIGTSDPQRRFVVEYSAISRLTNTALYNPDTTDNNGVVLSFRTDTTGAGATTFHEVAGVSSVTTSHDHATRNTDLLFMTDDYTGGTATKMTIKGNGNVGIGTTTDPGAKLDVNGDVRATGFIASSDRRLKKNFEKTNGLETISKLKGYRYEWKDTGKKDFGVIAQEVEKVMPEAVVTNPETGMKAVKYNGLFAPVIESIKELYSAITGQDKKIKEQDRKIASLEKKNKELEERLLKIEASLEKNPPNKK